MGKETAEQKLLKLIETTDAKDASSGAPAASSAAQEAQAALSSVTNVGVVPLALPPFLNNIVAYLRNFIFSGKQGTSFGLREVNKILVIAIVAVGLFFVKDFFGGMRKFHGTDFEDEKLADQNSALFIPTLRDMTEYVAAVARRNIFQPYEIKAADVSVEATGTTTLQKILDQTKDLKLVGISWLDTPESASAMIENKTNGVTYFLRPGDGIQNVKIKQIFADSVILTFDGEELELKL